MILLRRYRLTKSGHRGYGITLPKEYIEDAKLQAGQKMAIYREGEKLIIVPESREAEND